MWVMSSEANFFKMVVLPACKKNAFIILTVEQLSSYIVETKQKDTQFFVRSGLEFLEQRQKALAKMDKW